MPADTSKLYSIFSSPEEINRQADQALVEAIASQFPVQGKTHTLLVENVKAEPRDFTAQDQKDAILQSKSLTYPIKGTVKLVSNATGKVVDEINNFPLSDAFHLTGKHTLLYKGNNYTIANQLQLLPGVYTRTKENTGELEAHYNTAKGASFRILLDPQTQLFNIEIGGSSNPITPLLTRVFQVPTSEIEQYVPKEVWEANVAATAGKEDRIIKALYNRLVYTKNPSATPQEMAQVLRESLTKSVLHPETTKVTLGKSFDTVTPEVILRTLRNLVDVHKGIRPEDNRDSLQFKRVQNLPDYIRTRFAKEHDTVKAVKRRMTFGLEKIDANNPKIRDAIGSKPFNRVYSAYIQQSSLISTPSETNPIESIENVGKVTVLGPEEGGIAEERGVPMAARNIDPSHLGILDPSRTPESGHAGIDQRFAINAKRDREGHLYARVKDNQGKIHYLSVQEMMDSVIGFPDSKEPDGMCQAQVKGQMQRIKTSSVQYWVSDATDLYTITTNLVPFLNSNHPSRLTMAGKAIPQALSLVDREAPLVQTVSANGTPFVKALGTLFGTKTKKGGEVIRASENEVAIRSEDGTIERVRAIKNLPFNMKGFLDDEHPLVKPGDKVDANTPVFENNYTKNGELALGKNLHVAYLPYKGYNHEDGMVISESAASKLSSHHAYKVDYDVVPETVANKSLLKRYFPGKFTAEQLANLDESGYAKVGAVVKFGDPVYAVLEKREPSPEDRILGRLHKNLVNPYRLATELWHNEEQGEVVDTHTESKAVRILLRSKKPLEVGDKLTGLHGNKGIVSLILPDNSMPYVKDTGKPVDVLLNPASVTSRVNLGQLMETVAAKIADQTGQPYLVKNFDYGNNLTRIKQDLEKHGLSDTDTLVDPKTNRDIGKILTGKQYILKLYKTTTENLSARNVGGYDNIMQPTKGGEEGSKSVGYMEMLGLLGSDARKNLKEISTLKSEQNDEYWAKFIRGESLPKPKMTFATRKFFDYLKGSGVNVKHEGGMVTATPLTDKEILGMSNGEVKEPTMLNAKNLEPEDGGLYDYAITGGLKGDKWAHYRLAEPIVNPMFENPVKAILGLSTEEFKGITSGKYSVRPASAGLFTLHDSATGKHLKDIKVN